MPSRPEQDAARFIRVWQHALTIDDVAVQLGMTKRRASVRAEYYRRHAVPLKRFPKGRIARFNWARLAQVAVDGAGATTPKRRKQETDNAY